MASKPQTARITPKGVATGYRNGSTKQAKSGEKLSYERARVKLGDHPRTQDLGEKWSDKDWVRDSQARTNPHGAGTKKRKPTPKGRK